MPGYHRSQRCQITFSWYSNLFKHKIHNLDVTTAGLPLSLVSIASQSVAGCCRILILRQVATHWDTLRQDVSIDSLGHTATGCFQQHAINSIVPGSWSVTECRRDRTFSISATRVADCCRLLQYFSAAVSIGRSVLQSRSIASLCDALRHSATLCDSMETRL